LTITVGGRVTTFDPHHIDGREYELLMETDDERFRLIDSPLLVYRYLLLTIVIVHFTARQRRHHCKFIARYTGWAKKWDHYIGRPTSSAYIFKTSQPISVIFGTLQRHFILNTSADSNFIKQ